jgi:hypothetical protein
MQHSAKDPFDGPMDTECRLTISDAWLADKTAPNRRFINGIELLQGNVGSYGKMVIMTAGPYSPGEPTLPSGCLPCRAGDAGHLKNSMIEMDWKTGSLNPGNTSL